MTPLTRSTLILGSLFAVACSKAAPAPVQPAGGAPAANPSAPPNDLKPAPGQSPAPAQPAAAQPAAAADLQPTVENLGKILTGITDGPTAQAAKSKLDTIIGSLKSAAEAAKGQLGGDLGKLAGAAAAKAGVDLGAIKAAALQQVDKLLANDAIQGAIGPTLEQLKGYLK
ncbi:MAG: hypothetical protein FJ265_17845 [Planctomycetes bacterium]|nr:hypothetical protein [Planctomycetota bacterium]